MNDEIPQAEEIITEEEISQTEAIAEEEPSQPERSLFEKIFFSPEEHRLRTGWRLMIQSLLLVILLFGLQYIVSYYLLPNIPIPQTYSFLISKIIMLLAITGSVFVSRTLLDNRSFASLGLKMNSRAWIDLAVGIGIAALMMGIIFLAEWALGWLSFQDFAWNLQEPKTLTINILLFLGVFLLVGWQEELLSRGYWLQNLKDGLNTYWVIGIFIISALIIGLNYLTNWVMYLLPPFEGIIALQLSLWGLLSILMIFLIIYFEEKLSARWEWLQNKKDINLYWAILFSSLFFAVTHLGNSGFSVISLLGLIISGVFLAYGYTSTRRLWLPIGLHIGWNFFEGCVFGLPVSGLSVPRLLEYTVDGPILWTGGGFGPEAGLILLPALAVGAFFIWVYATQNTEED